MPGTDIELWNVRLDNRVTQTVRFGIKFNPDMFFGLSKKSCLAVHGVGGVQEGAFGYRFLDDFHLLVTVYGNKMSDIYTVFCGLLRVAS